MGFMRSVTDFFAAEAKRSRRGSRFWMSTYGWDRPQGYGLPQPAGGRWHVIVDWKPIPEATAEYRAWSARLEISADEHKDGIRREVRETEGGQMRVLVSPELWRRAQGP
jgi:hypothetical protein